MLDSDIRPNLKTLIVESLHEAVIFDELPLCRKGRADVAAVNCSLWGYEIKSDRDSLNRLPTQIDNYDAIFDYSIAVVAPKHLLYASEITPKHWGIWEIQTSDNGLMFNEVREPQRNTAFCTASRIKLLWRTECTKVLREFGYKVSSKALVSQIWQMMSELPLSHLDEAIRLTLKARRD